jgi:hypothetical protein
MGLWLMPEPESFRAFFFSSPDDASIADLVDRLSPLKKQGLLPSAVHIANDLRASRHGCSIHGNERAARRRCLRRFERSCVESTASAPGTGAARSWDRRQSCQPSRKKSKPL